MLNVIKNNEHFFHFKNYPRGALLFNEGDICKSLGIILEGEITISTLTALDKEYTINVLTKGMMFGETLLFTDNNKFLGDIIATRDTRIAFINKNKLLVLLQKTPILEVYLKTLALKSQALNARVKLLSQKNLRDKVLFFLFEERKRQNTNLIKITSKENIASLLNIPRPSLSREISKLQNEGLIKSAKRTIEILI